MFIFGLVSGVFGIIALIFCLSDFFVFHSARTNSKSIEDVNKPGLCVRIIERRA